MEHTTNTITLRGSLLALPRFSHSNHGRKFYRFTLEVPRLSGAVDQLLAGAAQIGSVKVLTVSVQDTDAGALRQMGDVLKDKQPAVVAVLASVAGDKVTFLAVCGKDAVKAGIKAGDLVKYVCTVCGGSGGGKPDSAMGGGKDAGKVSEALAGVEGFGASKF